ncbi:uncharacterized protein LOC130768145 [Actinidia eriantha]|uniref:uncharacterized protein LOC130768145 n=1 Tax=Actinidia eriantha TaxID=165200 RepID=UPI0025897D46|nr:uncharacterized protein LOC130768145 [Actinidia eriantha]
MPRRSPDSDFVRGTANSSLDGSYVNNLTRVQHNVDAVNASNASTSRDSNAEQGRLLASTHVDIETYKRSLEECYSETNGNRTSSGPLILRSATTSDAVPQRLDLNVAYEDTNQGIQQEGTGDHSITFVGDQERSVRRRTTPASTSSAVHRDNISSGLDLISSPSLGSAPFTSPEEASTSQLVRGTGVNIVGSSQRGPGFPFHANISRGSRLSFVEERLADIARHSSVGLPSHGSQLQTSTNHNRPDSIGSNLESRVRSLRDPRLMRDARRSFSLLPAAFAQPRRHLIQQLIDLFNSENGEGFRYENLFAPQVVIGNVGSGLSQEAILAGVGHRLYQSVELGSPMEKEMCCICQVNELFLFDCCF